jgi:POT family proton-dependent oligopeptide transporter
MASSLLYAGLGLLIAGNGLFKPNISSMVGQLYAKDDKRVDSAFTIFYMGINAGSLIAPLICGTLGDTGNPDDFKWGFLAAGCGMLFSLLVFSLFKNKYLVTPEGKPIGMAPQRHHASGEKVVHAPLTRVEKERLAVILIVSAFVIFFWSAFEQAGASLTFFAEEQTNRNLLGFTVPASYFQSINRSRGHFCPAVCHAVDHAGQAGPRADLAGQDGIWPAVPGHRLSGHRFRGGWPGAWRQGQHAVAGQPVHAAYLR